jgi:lysophospholipase L1-like esterase
MRNTFLSVSILCLSLFQASYAWADGPLLGDRNGDGDVEVLAFGDSITYGVGDGNAPGEYVGAISDIGEPRGYPLRLSSLLGVTVLNAGIPGEELVGLSGLRESGVDRFPTTALGSSADVIILMEGSNDARYDASPSQYARILQKVINVARADNRALLLATLPPPTLQRAEFAPRVISYSSVVRDLGAVNTVPVVDVAAGFLTECPEISTCQYYNLPEGLHPNTVGYDAIASMMANALQE